MLPNGGTRRRPTDYADEISSQIAEEIREGDIETKKAHFADLASQGKLEEARDVVWGAACTVFTAPATTIATQGDADRSCQSYPNALLASDASNPSPPPGPGSWVNVAANPRSGGPGAWGPRMVRRPSE